jgi:hypothetical protein
LSEVKIHRALGAAALTVCFTAGAAAPALAAATVERPAPHVQTRAALAADATAACTALAEQLVSQVTGIGTGLLAVPPNVSAATGLVGQVLGDVTALQSAGCLPALPPTGTGTPTVCVPDVAKLLSDAFALLADLTAATPNVTGAVSTVSELVSDLSGLVTAKCLPSVTLPSIPGLPAVPATPSLPSTPSLPAAPTV